MMNIIKRLVQIFTIFAFLFTSCEHRTNALSIERPIPICPTEHCNQTAMRILSSIDMNVDPCDDFYAFACNGLIRDNPITADVSSWNTFQQLEQSNTLLIRDLLEKPASESASEAEKKAKKYYVSCLDADETIEQLGADPLQKLLRQVGGWNVTAVTSGFDPAAFSVSSSMKLLRNRYGVDSGFFDWSVTVDERNSSRSVIHIDQGGLILPQNHYLNKEEYATVQDAYLDTIQNVAVLLGGNAEEVRPQVERLVAFETRLAEITIQQDERLDIEVNYNLMTLRELQQLSPFIDWQDYLDDAFVLVERQITDMEEVVVLAPDYLAKLSAIVLEYNSTDEGRITLSNYMVWQLVRSFVDYLAKPFQEASEGLGKAVFGTEGDGERWRHCVKQTSNVFGFAIGAMFVREVFHDEAKLQSEQMIDEIRFAFQDNLRNLQWMDDETRVLAVEKADAIIEMIGFPDYILQPALLDKKYHDLDVAPDMYFENNLRVLVYSQMRMLERLDQPVNRTEWDRIPSEVNANYVPQVNRIAFPAGILRTPFYDSRNAKSLNFGGIGSVMGHELTHAFDDVGRLFDKIGNLRQWWNTETVERFKEQAECLVEQYDGYNVNGKSLNGKLTLGENIADIGGLKAAFRAYVASENESAADTMLLPELDMTHRQLFFVSYAQLWCWAETKELQNFRIESDPHSPPRFRVIGSLSNLPEFSEEFGCPLGSPMNPVNKCEVW